MLKKTLGICCVAALAFQARANEPNLISVEVDGESTSQGSKTFYVETDQEFWVYVEMENDIGTDRRGGITVSLPDFDGSVLDYSFSCVYKTSPYDCHVLPTGSTVWNFGGGAQISTDDIIVESYESGWSAYNGGENQTLKFKLKAKSTPETFYIYARGWLCFTEDEWGSDNWVVYSMNPMTSSYRDQQNYPVFRYKVVVQEPPKPDLRVKDISFSPSSPKVDQNVKITATLENDGDGDAPSATLYYYMRYNRKLWMRKKSVSF